MAHVIEDLRRMRKCSAYDVAKSLSRVLDMAIMNQMIKPENIDKFILM